MSLENGIKNTVFAQSVIMKMHLMGAQGAERTNQKGMSKND